MSEDPTARATPPDPLADLGKMAGELVHDLANDVQVLQGWAHLARGEVELHRLPATEVERLVELSESLGRMLRDVLATLSGQTVSPEVSFDPTALTESTVEQRLAEITPPGIHLRSDLPAGVRVRGPASFWVRILVNLLRNAGRHARARIQVSLSLERTPDGHAWVVLRVEDDGPGIAPELRGAVFRPLWRGEGGGFGLGLSSVAWATEQLRGEVRYVSDSALEGAAFEVWVPAVLAPRRPDEAPESPAGSAEGLRLMIVDDDPSIRFALARLLRRSGAEVREVDPVGEPEERLMATMRSMLPDVVLLDLRLGERGGLSVWRRMCTDVPHLVSRVLFISGVAPGDPMWEEALGTGQPVLAKPFDLEQLLGALVRFRERA